MKSLFLRIVSGVSVVTVILSAHVSASRRELNTVDRDYLIKAVASSYPDVSFGARVAIVAVVMNRVNSPSYPDTAAGAIVSLGDMFALPSSTKIDPEIQRLTSDAIDAVIDGADPTNGCTSFVCHERLQRDGNLSARTPLDLFFNDYSEENIKRDILSSMNNCKVIIDGIGFY